MRCRPAGLEDAVYGAVGLSGLLGCWPSRASMAGRGGPGVGFILEAGASSWGCWSWSVSALGRAAMGNMARASSMGQGAGAPRQA